MARRTPRWRRIIRSVVRVAAFGVVINVLVCWALVFIAPNGVRDISTPRRDDAIRTAWQSTSRIGWTVIYLDVENEGYAEALRAQAPQRPLPSWVPDPNLAEQLIWAGDDTFNTGWFFAEGFGFPLRSMSRVNTRGTGMAEGGFCILAGKRGWYFPLLVAWVPFVFDALIWGSAIEVCLLMCGPFRRWNRARRNLCTGCRYDLRGLPPSTPAGPECGAAIHTIASHA